MVTLNLNLPPSTLERLVSALERIAYATEKIAGPDIRMEPIKPYGPELWGYSSNAQSLENELLEKQEATGYGPTYQADIESRARAAAAQRPPNGPDIKQG